VRSFSHSLTLTLSTQSLLLTRVTCPSRPFGALLDNVVNGWRYQPVDWLDVSHRGLIKAMQVCY